MERLIVIQGLEDAKEIIVHESKINELNRESKNLFASAASFIDDALTYIKEQQSLSEQDKADLDLIHRVRSGQVKKSVCREYSIYNGDWYRDHPWNVPKEQEEPHLLTLEELMEIDPQTVLWNDIRDDQQDGPLDERGWMILHPVCFCGFDKIEIEPGQGKEEVVLFALGFDRLADYGKTFALWTGRPTDQQRREAWQK